MLMFVAGHTLLLAHGKAWHVYDREFRQTQKGRVSIVLNSDYHFPQKNEDIFLKAAKRGMEWTLGWFANPIYINGDYPEVMKTLIAKHSKMEGIPNRYSRYNKVSTYVSRCVRATHHPYSHLTANISSVNYEL